MIKFELYLGRNEGDQPIEADRLAGFFADEACNILKGFTVVNALGIWEGATEDSFVLIHIGDATSRKSVRQLGQAYKARFHQMEVYLTETLITLEVI